MLTGQEFLLFTPELLELSLDICTYLSNLMFRIDGANER